MSSLTSELERLRIQVMAYAAIGAALKIRAAGVTGDRAVVEKLEDIARAVHPHLLDAITVSDAEAALLQIQNFLSEATDLIKHADRPAGWSHDDPAHLQKLGTASSAFVRHITNAAATRPALAATLGSAGQFLDVGTGVAGIAIAAARAWPTMQVVGIDILPAALKLAQSNVAASGVASRIVLREQSVADVTDSDVFNAAYLPTTFIPGNIVERALASLKTALVPGGILFAAVTKIPEDKLGAAVARLRPVRAGGYPWTAEEIAARLQKLNYSEVEILATGGHAQLITGRRPL